MAITDPKAWPESTRELAIEVEKCIQLYMGRDETAPSIDTHTGIDRQITLKDPQVQSIARATASGYELSSGVWAESDKLPAIPVSSVGSEEVAGSAPHLMPGCSLAPSSLEAQGMRISAALDSAQRPILRVQNLISGAQNAGNFGGSFQSTSMAQSLSHLDSNLEASVQEDFANLALD